MPVDPVVHVVDDDDSLRRAITRLLEAAGHSACGYANAAEFLAGAWRDAPGCLLLDIQLPGKSGMELQEALFQSPSPLPIIFLTGRADVPMSVRAMKLGAVDFLMKPVTSEVLLTAVRIALARDAENRAPRERLRDLRACYEQLTPREKEVLVHVAQGKLNKQIAAEIGTALRTVKAHRGQVMRKMRVDSVAELVRAADELGKG